VAKGIYINLKFSSHYMCTGGPVVESWAVDPRDVCLPPALCLSLSSLSVLSVKLCILENFALYLRNTWSLNLRAIESCVCSIRSMRSISRTVQVTCRLQFVQIAGQVGVPSLQLLMHFDIMYDLIGLRASLPK
jgi:hypothetical protein